MKNFLKGLKYERIISIAVIAILVFLNFKSCQSNKDKAPEIVTSTTTTCDTVYQEVTKEVIKWRKAAIPEPVIEVVTVYETDTVYITNVEIPEPEIHIVEKELSILSYVDSIETDKYRFDYEIGTLGELFSFQYAITPKFEVKQTTTNTIIQKEEDRNWLLLFEGMAQGNIKEMESLKDAEFYLGGSVVRTWRRTALGVGYHNQVNGDGQIFNLKAGLRF